MPGNAINVLSSLLGAFSSFIYTHFNTSLSALRSSFFYMIRMPSIHSFNHIIAITIPVLTNFLQLKNKDPFLTHPRAMHLAVSSTVVFYIAFIALLRFPLRRRAAVIADHCMFSFVNASIASLASVLLPDSLGPLVYAIFGLLSSGELLYWLYRKLVDGDEEFDVGRMRVSVFLNNIWTALSNSDGQPQQELPV